MAVSLYIGSVPIRGLFIRYCMILLMFCCIVSIWVFSSWFSFFNIVMVCMVSSGVVVSIFKCGIAFSLYTCLCFSMFSGVAEVSI